MKIPELPVKECKKREGEGSSRGAKGLRSSEGSSRGSSWRAWTECAAGQEPWIGKGGDGGAEQGTAQGSPLASTQGARSARGAQRPPPLPQRRAQSWTQRRSQSRTQPKAQSRTDYSRSSRGHPLEGLGIGTGLHRLGEEMAAQGDTGKTQMDRRLGLWPAKRGGKKGEDDAAGAPGARHGQLGPLLRRRALKWRRQRHADEIRKRGPRGVPQSCGGARV